MEDVLVRFKNRIYVSDSSELKNIIMRFFHVKSFSGHLGY